MQKMRGKRKPSKYGKYWEKRLSDTNGPHARAHLVSYTVNRRQISRCTVFSFNRGVADMV